MSKINILESVIYNRISAGEVVERPYSVVKELVENSIDAGADKIEIEITDGGISRIKITDNGSGIEKTELKSAILPHATSKISKVEDLERINTLGFRGEALASIASVSKLKIVSKPASQECGAEIEVNGGEIQEVEDCPLNCGTEITVDNLFYNTPARQKFLKTPKSEESDISNLISRLILGNPKISIKYIANNKIIYQSFGDGLSESMINIYSSKILEDCFYIDSNKNGIKINGYIGKHYFSKPNRTYQTVFLNDRYINNLTISSAISNAYSSYLMKRQYPFYVINITVPSEIVDVNVHPNKTDVRFSNNQIIYGFLYSTISKVLDGTSEAVNIVKDNNLKETIENDENIEQSLKSINCQQSNDKIPKDYDTHKAYPTPPTRDLKLKLCDHTNYQNSNKQVFEKIKENIYSSNNDSLNDIFSKNLGNNLKNEDNNLDKSNIIKEKIIKENNIKEDEIDESLTLEKAFLNKATSINSKNIDNLDIKYNIDLEPNKVLKCSNNIENKSFLENEFNKNTKPNITEQSIEIEKKYNIIGQALNTYLLFDDAVDIYIIDQHAAHERIKFDRFMSNFTSKKLFTQPLLAPYVLEINNEEKEFIDSKINYLNDLGIDIEKFGYNAYKINSVPTDIIDIDLKYFFNDLLKDLSILKKETVPSIIYDKIAQKACKSAIKAGDKLNESEIKEILKLLKGNLGLKCPHGRPICVKISKNEIEKWFKRIV